MVSRRDFLKLTGLGAGAALLNACAPQLASTPQQSSLLDPPAAFKTPVSTRTPRIITPTPDASPTPDITPISPAIWKPFWQSRYDSLKLCFVLWDHQLAKYGFLPRNRSSPVPETCPLYSGAVNPMTPEWITYWKGILRLCNPTMDEKHFESAWYSLVDKDRAFTNFTGLDSGNFAIHSVTCGGATHEMVTGIPEGKYMSIYTLNWGSGPPPVPSDPRAIDMTRHFFATTGSNVKLADGSYAVYGFPQFENCIVPLISQGDTDRIEVSRIKEVTGLQKPYNP